MSDLKAFLQSMRVLYEEVAQINPYEDTVLIWKSTMKKTYVKQRTDYTTFLKQFIKEFVYYPDYVVAEKHFSKESVIEFLESGNDKKEFYFRLYNEDEIKWYCAILVHTSGDDQNVVLLIQERDEAYNNFFMQRAMNAPYELIVGIQAATGAYSIYQFQGSVKKYMLYMDYEGCMICKVFQCVDVDMIDDALHKLSIHTIKAQLEIHEEYVVYCTFVMHQNKYYKRYRFSYLDETREVILMSRMDVTEEIEAEKQKNIILKNALYEARKAIREKSDMVSRMSHDLRTPLNSILGLSMLAASDIQNTESVLNNLNDITMSGKYLLAMMNDILAERKDGQELSVEKEDFSLSEMTNDLQKMMEPFVRKHRHHLQTQCFVEHDLVNGNKKWLERIVINLLTNAIKYTPDKGKIFLSVTEETGSSAKEAKFKIEVKDNGIGISQEYLKNIFSPFTRERSVQETDISGSGLGMSIVKNLLDKMGGKITIDSEVGKGTKIIILCPFLVVKEEKKNRENRTDDWQNTESMGFF